jgi:hypothetical protein
MRESKRKVRKGREEKEKRRDENLYFNYCIFLSVSLSL